MKFQFKLGQEVRIKCDWKEYMHSNSGHINLMVVGRFWFEEIGVEVPQEKYHCRVVGSIEHSAHIICFNGAELMDSFAFRERELEKKMEDEDYMEESRARIKGMRDEKKKIEVETGKKITTYRSRQSEDGKKIVYTYVFADGTTEVRERELGEPGKPEKPKE